MPARVLVLVALLAPSTFGATFTVTSSSDSGPGTLRQAILDANATPGHDQVGFTVLFVDLESPLPLIVEPVDIDGATAAGDVRVQPSFFESPVFQFGAGSGGSVLTHLDIGGLVHIRAGADGITIQSVQSGNLLVESNDNLIADNSFDHVNDIRLQGHRNQVLGNRFLFRIFVSGNDNRIGSLAAGNEVENIELRSGTGTIIEGNSMFGAGGSGAIQTAIIVTSGVPEASRTSITTLPTLTSDRTRHRIIPSSPPLFSRRRSSPLPAR